MTEKGMWRNVHKTVYSGCERVGGDRVRGVDGDEVKTVDVPPGGIGYLVFALDDVRM